MMRTLEEIKQHIAADFMRSEAAAAAFGFRAGESFAAHFSRASVISVLFYVFAAAAWTLEALFDTYRAEVDARIDALIPHRPKWYRDKMLAFVKDRPLLPDSDRCDTAGMTEAQIAAAQVIRHATADENAAASLLTIKIAGERDGRRCPLDTETERQVAAYLARIKDAGVRTVLVNTAPDRFDCDADIYFDAMLTASAVENACRAAIADYVENLPFNGEYTHMALIDRLQTVEGVRIAELRSAAATAAGEHFVQTIDARCVPAAGYFTAGTVQLNMKVYNG